MIFYAFVAVGLKDLFVRDANIFSVIIEKSVGGRQSQCETCSFRNAPNSLI